MSEFDGRYRDDGTGPHGSSAVRGTPLPDRQLADQPTDVVPTLPREDDALADRTTDVVPTLQRQDTLADQTTDVVPTLPRQETLASTVPAYAVPRPDRPAPVEPDAWRQDEEPPADVLPWDDATPPTEPDYRDAPVVVRRADTLAGLLLVLAGIAAGISLLVVWVNGGATGLDLVRDGITDAQTPQRLAQEGTWAPLVVVAGGAVLFLLGLLMYVPAKTHRLLGALALLVTLVVAAAVLVPLADADWDVQRWAVGGWFTVAVGGLGFLGALKALSTGPRNRRT
jgi:hypothetical protein